MSGDSFPRQYSIVAETRRRWSDREKQKIVAEAERPDANISAVARRHGVKPSLLFRWRRLAREEEELARTNAPAFAPVTLALPSGSAEEPASAAAPVGALPPGSIPEAARHADDRIEIEFGGGWLVRVGAGVDAGALKRVLDVLDRSGDDGRRKP
jgi:transposase